MIALHHGWCPTSEGGAEVLHQRARLPPRQRPSGHRRRRRPQRARPARRQGWRQRQLLGRPPRPAPAAEGRSVREGVPAIGAKASLCHVPCLCRRRRGRRVQRGAAREDGAAERGEATDGRQCDADVARQHLKGNRRSPRDLPLASGRYSGDTNHCQVESALQVQTLHGTDVRPQSLPRRNGLVPEPQQLDLHAPREVLDFSEVVE
mmetsp:Transcript_36413/g.104719  ORF Transcript_36413/g.104719 Transcript_36413/m.104719 type:complete len:206 (+) Transcript_36413:855-1472(+)